MTVALADVAVPAPLPRALSYLVPDAMAAEVLPGRRVLCTLGARRVVGVVVGVRHAEPPPTAKPLLSVLDGVTLPDDLVGFLTKLSNYYFAPPGEVMRLALPPTDRETVEAVEEPTLFGTTKGVSARRVQWVVATDVVETSIKAGGPSRLLAFVRAHGALPRA